VNGSRVDIPSYRLKVGDEVAISTQGQKMVIIKENLKAFSKNGLVPWLSLDPDNMKGSFLAVPRKNEVVEVKDIQEQLIVELYSR